MKNTFENFKGIFIIINTDSDITLEISNDMRDYCKSSIEIKTNYSMKFPLYSVKIDPISI